MIYKDDFACFFELLKQVVQWFDGILGSCIKPNHCQPHVFVPFSQIGASRGSLWSDPVVQLKRYLCPFLFGYWLCLKQQQLLQQKWLARQLVPSSKVKM